MFSPRRSVPRILLVDDDPSVVHVLGRTLQEIGETVFEKTGAAALARVEASQPDVILLDIEMPGLDGYDVLRRLQASPAMRRIPVLFITAHDSVEHQLRCLQEGAVDFIAKPLHPAVVAARVRTQLDLRRHERESLAVYRHAQVTLASIGDAVITTDNQCRITYMNPVAELMTGFSFDRAAGKSIDEIMPLRTGEDGPPHANPVRLAIQEQRVVGMGLNCQMKTQAGRWIPVEDSAAPLMSEDNEVSGAVIVFHEVDPARALALKMAHRTQYDQLTNLPNRFLMLDLLSSELEVSATYQRKTALIAVDINHFKLINEQLGFEYGDQILTELASSIKAVLHQGETLGRNQSDEFLVLVPHAEAGSLNVLISAIRTAVATLGQRRPEIKELSVGLGVSICPGDAGDAEAMVLHADAALQRAKRDPSFDGVCFYSQEFERRYVQRRKSYQAVKTALADDRVVPLFQPMVHPATGEAIAVEALVRLRGDDGHLMPPAEFIPMAEESGLIIPLGERMIDLVFAQQRRWLDAGRSIRVCLNISAVQFVDPNFWPTLRHLITTYGISPDQIELEVTESLMLQSRQHVVQTMQEMREQGLTISIDDFGTGYSSISYLSDLPIDVLKIDKSFVQRLSPQRPDEALVKMIVNMAQTMGLQTVAEGVETKFQANRLTSLGVNLLQGYFFSRPVPADLIEAVYAL